MAATIIITNMIMLKLRFLRRRVGECSTEGLLSSPKKAGVLGRFRWASTNEENPKIAIAIANMPRARTWGVTMNSPWVRRRY